MTSPKYDHSLRLVRNRAYADEEVEVSKGASRVRSLVPTVAIVAAAALVGCSQQGGSQQQGGSEQPQELTPVVLPVAANAGYAPWDVAMERGFFEDHGLAATLKTFDNGVAGTQAMLAGQVQAGGTVEMPLIANLAQGADIIVPAVWFTGQELRLVVDAGIQTSEDLAGRTIGVQEGGINDYAFQRYMEEQGIDPKSVTMVNVPGAEQVATMARGDIDGFVNEEPIVSSAFEELGERVHFLEPSISDTTTVRNYLQFDRTWAEENPETVEAVIAALIDANAFIEENPEEAAQIAGGRIGVEPETLQKWWAEGGIRWDLYLDDDSRTALGDVADWMAENAYVDEAPDTEAVFDTSYLEAVDPDAVQISG